MNRWAWPSTAAALVELQLELAEAARHVEAWSPPSRPLRVGAVFAAAQRGLVGAGARGDPAWAAAVVLEGGRPADSAILEGAFGAPYEPGLLALRSGPVLEAAVRRLKVVPDLLLVDATGFDHPRGAGLAIHLGALLDLPTIGVTDRSLTGAAGDPLTTRTGARPLYVHAAWRTDSATAREVVLSLIGRFRTPEPLRQARRLARLARVRGVVQPGTG